MQLQVRGIVKRYQKQNVLDQVGFSIAPGESLGVAGHNGSGKSTLLSIVAQMISPDAGEILYEGKSVVGNRDFMRRMVGYTPQKNALLPDLTTLETLQFFAKLYGIEKRAIFAPDSVAKQMGLAQIQHKKVKSLSGGMQKRLSIALSLLHTPRFLLLDEALGALDRNFRNAFKCVIEDYLQKGGAVIYCSHEAEELRSFCDRILLLRGGKTIFYSSIADFPQDQRVLDEMLTPPLQAAR